MIQSELWVYEGPLHYDLYFCVYLKLSTIKIGEKKEKEKEGQGD